MSVGRFQTWSPHSLSQTANDDGDRCNIEARELDCNNFMMSSNNVHTSFVSISPSTFFLFLFAALVLIAFIVTFFEYSPPIFGQLTPPSPDLERAPLLTAEHATPEDEQRSSGGPERG